MPHLQILGDPVVWQRRAERMKDGRRQVRIFQLHESGVRRMTHEGGPTAVERYKAAAERELVEWQR